MGTIFVKYCMIKICMINNSILLFIIIVVLNSKLIRSRKSMKIEHMQIPMIPQMSVFPVFSRARFRVKQRTIKTFTQWNSFYYNICTTCSQKNRNIFMLIYLLCMHVHCSMFTVFFFLIWLEFNLRISLHHILLV